MSDADALAPESPRRSRWGLKLIALALAQTAVLGWMLWDRVAILQAPTEIRLTPLPIDPRDLFRGDYVTLRYGISTVPPEFLSALEDVRRGDRLWATIAPAPPGGDTEPETDPDAVEQNDDGWRIVAISRERPPQPASPAVLLQGRAAQPRAYSIDYGVEWYFVPEGEGRRLETMIGDRALEVTLAVDGDGRAAIKALTAEGETVYVEPLL